MAGELELHHRKRLLSSLVQDRAAHAASGKQKIAPPMSLPSGALARLVGSLQPRAAGGEPG
jgi:hypothetical protein